MPWKVEKAGEEWCVYKKDSEGEAVGEALGCHKERSAAEAQIKALYANVKEYGDSLNDFIERARNSFSRRFPTSYVGNGDTLYSYVTDVFQDHVVVRRGDSYWQVGMKVSEDSVEFDETKDWEPVKLSYVTELLQENIRDVMVVWEFKGKYPDIPFATGVDVESLTEGDSEPVFLTLPIGKANVVSGNKRYYDAKFVQALEAQVQANKPVGLMGHLSESARATEFPSEAVHWVGAKVSEGLLWGKGYVPPGDARSRIKRYRASGKKIATSIDAYIEGKWDPQLNAYRMDADTLKLNQIDIAPADRAGVADLAAVPHLTKEMAVAGVAQATQEEEDPMDRLEIIREMTAEDARLLPKEVREAILSLAETPQEVNQVGQVRELLGITDGADFVSFFKEWKAAEEQRKVERVKARIQELLADADKGIKVEKARPLVLELVNNRNPKTEQEAEAAYMEITSSEAVKEMLSLLVQNTMGPAQKASIPGQSSAPKYFPVPEVA